MKFLQHFKGEGKFPISDFVRFNTPLYTHEKMKIANGVTQELVKSSQVATVVIDAKIALVTLGKWKVGVVTNLNDDTRGLVFSTAATS